MAAGLNQAAFTLAELVRRGDYAAVSQLAAGNCLVLTRVLGLTYCADELAGWRACWALGQASVVVARQDPEFIRNLLRRLVWSLNDESGSIGWRSPQAMGAVIAADQAAFSEFVPLLVSLLDLEERGFLPGTLWAIGHLASQGIPVTASVPEAAARVRTHLQAPEPQVRGMAVHCAGLLLDADARPSIQHLLGDPAPLTVFDGLDLVGRTVGSLAAAALAAIDER